MKNVFILSALGLSLLASANVTAANNFPRDSRFSSTTGGEKILLEGDDGYRTSTYTQRDLDELINQQKNHGRELQQLRDGNRDKEREINELKRSLQEENRNKDRQIDELKRSLQELSNKVKG
ncbi:hypothetical protein [Serratia rubidaea]|uniref:hypothetical protein n=1 Tax=Serratia rubidaea TaxID=61652 RepID=UPI003FA386A9